MTIPASPQSAVAPDFGPPDLIEGSLSSLVRGMRGSEILRIAGEIRRLQAEGRPVCNLTVGDFDPRHFPIPEPLLEGLHAALDRRETNYPPSHGLPELRAAVRERVARDLGIAFPVESVLIASGVRPLIYAAFRAVVDPRDPVVFGVPSWNLNHYAYLTGGRGVPVPAEQACGFQPTLRQLAPHLGEARLLCLCSPANPMGTVMPPRELQRITEAVVEENRRRAKAQRPGLMLLYDQVYGSLIYGGAVHANPVALVPEAAPWTIVLDGISKAFASTGLRVGWALASPSLIARMSDFLGHVGAWAPRPEQAATAGFLGDDEGIDVFRTRMHAGIRARLDALTRGFGALRAEGLPIDFVEPEGAIYLSLRLDLVGRRVAGRVVRSNEDLRQLLLHDAGLAAVPFQAFGLPDDSGWFRLSVGAVSLEDIGAALKRVRETLLR